VFKTRILSILITTLLVCANMHSARAESVYELLSVALTGSLSKPQKITKLEKVLEYTKLTNKIIGEREVKILIENAPKVSKDIRVLVLRIMNSSKNIAVLEHYGQYLKTGSELIYKFYMVSSMKALKINIDPENDQEFERYKQADSELSKELVKLLNHKNPNLRFVTITTVGARHVKESIPLLISLFAKEVEQINLEISKALVELNAKEELEAAMLNENVKIKKWAKRTYDNLMNGKREAFAHLKSRSLIQEFILIHLQTEDETIKKDILKYTQLLEEEKPLIKATIEIGAFGYKYLPENVKLDAKYATLCENAHKAFFLYPKNLTTQYDHSQLSEKYATCRTFLASKMLEKAKFYLSKAQRRRNSHSSRSAIKILSKLLLNYKGLGHEIAASINLAHAYYYDHRKKEAKKLVNEIFKIHGQFLTKKQTKKLNKLLRKI